MGVFDKKKKTIRVRTNWFQHAGTRHGPAFWIEVGRRVRAAGIRADDHEAIACVVREVEFQAIQRKGRP